MLRLIGLVLSISLADSMNPSTIAPALYLASGKDPRRSLIQFTAAVFAVNLVGGGVIAFGPGEVLLALVPHPGHTARYIAETVAGVVMLIAAALLWQRRKKLARKELPSPSTDGKSAALLGVTIGGVELLTAFPYFAAIAAIVGSGFGPIHQLIFLALYNGGFVLPLLAILLIVEIKGDEAQKILGSARDWLQRHWPVLLAGLALIAGLFVAFLGISGLLSGQHSSVGRLLRRFRRRFH
jgi:cytochrome c biogenesis protein CcdA